MNAPIFSLRKSARSVSSLVVVLSSLAVALFATGCPTTPSPQVVGQQPLANATNVGIATTITAQFQIRLNPATLTATSFQVLELPTLVPVVGDITWDNTNLIARFEPAWNLDYSKTYRVVLAPTITSHQGRPLEREVRWEFQTGANPDVQPPRIVEFNPANGRTDVEPERVIQVRFDEQIDSSIANLERINLVYDAGSSIVETRKMCEGNICSVTPVRSLAPQSNYTIVVQAGITDQAGNATTTQQTSIFTTRSRSWGTSVLVANSADSTTSFIEPWNATLVVGSSAPVVVTRPDVRTVQIANLDLTARRFVLGDVVATSDTANMVPKGIVSTAHGELAVFYAQQDTPGATETLRVRVRHPELGWTAPHTLGAISSGSLPQVVALENGEIWASWTGQVSGNSVCFANSWSPTIRGWLLTSQNLTPAGMICHSPIVKADDEDRVFVETIESQSSTAYRLASWHKVDDELVRYATSTPSTTNITRLFDVNHAGARVRILSRQGSTAGNRLLSAQFFDAATGNWGAEVSLGSSEYSTLSLLGVRMLSDISAVIMWKYQHADSNYRAPYAIVTNGSSTLTAREFPVTDRTRTRFADFAIESDRHGNAIVLSDDERRFQSHVYSAVTRAWQSTAPVTLAGSPNEVASSYDAVFTRDGRGFAFVQTSDVPAPGAATVRRVYFNFYR